MTLRLRVGWWHHSLGEGPEEKEQVSRVRNIWVYIIAGHLAVCLWPSYLTFWSLSTSVQEDIKCQSHERAEKETYQKAKQHQWRVQILKAAFLGLNFGCVPWFVRWSWMSFSFLICKMEIIILHILYKYRRELNELIYVRHSE